jgi:adenine-specific DNA-methyltransferase
VGAVREDEIQDSVVIATERHLAAIAGRLIGKGTRLSAQERNLVATAGAIPVRELTAARSAILAGTDPLGEAFGQIRSAEDRRGQGAVYTPAAIVDAMIGWAAEQAIVPWRIVDPGSGSGRFLAAAARVFPKAALVAIEIDPLAALLTRANATVLGFADRLTIAVSDYRELSLPPIRGPTLFIGNPPYVRHHNISSEWKRWFSSTARIVGLRASRLAGLHIHFFLKTHELARDGDFGAFVTAAEWLDVNYGAVLRRMLADGLGGTAVHVIDPKAMPFAGTFTTGAVTCFRVGRRPDQIVIRRVEALAELAPLSRGRRMAWDVVEAAPRWSILLQNPRSQNHGELELGELFRVHRGQVTGSNAVWIAGPQAARLPRRYLFPAITKARELLNAGEALTTTAHLMKVVDLPVDLDELTSAERAVVDEFLAWAKRHQAHITYIATHRRAWWSVELRRPATILCTYMARRPPAFVLNCAGARHLNIAHGLYPRAPIGEADLRAVLAYLRRCVTTADGRVYAGGLVKFEPKELERIRLPRLEDIHDYLIKGEKDLSEKVVPKRASARRDKGDGCISRRRIESLAPPR